MKPEEAGAHEEGERDKEEASIAAAMRGLARRKGKDAGHPSGAKDELEVGRVVLPLDIECWLPEKQTEAEKGKSG